jgi:hypothetical protein
MAKTYKAINFYKKDKKGKGKASEWKLIHRIKNNGQFVHIKNSNWFTIVDDDNDGVCYYEFD